MASGTNQMKREDLLVLTDEDLALLSNKGTVKRARREIEEKSVDGTITDSDDGTVKIEWTDGVVCTLSNNERLSERQCTCSAVEVCRHLVRAVILYQQLHSKVGAKTIGDQLPDKKTQPTAAETITLSEPEFAHEAAGADSIPPAQPPANEPVSNTAESEADLTPQNLEAEYWNPGEISDESIESIMKAAVLKRARTLFDQGQLVQLVKAKKPLATFLSLGTSIRFLVKNDIRYTFCNCKEEQPCVHAPLAVWSFRKLKSNSGIIYSGSKAEQIEPTLINSVENELINLIKVGLAQVSAMGIAHLKDGINKCAKAKLYSSAEILEEIVDDWQKYQEVDSRFSEETLLESIAELIIRHDFLLSGSAALPFLMVKGLSSERNNLIASARLVGIGCGVAQKKKHTIISAYFQDEANGSLCALVQRNAERENNEEQRLYHALASRLQYKSQSIAGLGKSAIFAKGLKLSTSREISFGRNPFLAGAQTFDWSQLKAPIFAESFSELRQLASLTAPPYLGLRAIGSKIHVVAIDRINFPTFSILDQAITAQLIDRAGEVATLHHPYMSRGAAGTEKVLKELLRQDQRCVFISGEVINRASGLQIRPIGIVFEDKEGKRHLCQPWVDKEEGSKKETDDEFGGTLDERQSDLADLVRDVGEFLSNILLIGLNNTNEDLTKRLNFLTARSNNVGSQLIRTHLQLLSAEMERKLHDPQWDSTPAAQRFLTLGVVWRIAQDELARLN
ncbi:MAG: hypothetical protein K2X77_00580 [Candidatus Obscuribacterales bacterium]|nr:hypothetical protein [Candidatus Obscuribacterales bacterium]